MRSSLQESFGEAPDENRDRQTWRPALTSESPQQSERRGYAKDCIGFTAIVGILTFLAHRKLPYRKMLVFTGIMLGFVLLVMVGEQIQEMQLAHWLPTTQIPWLANRLPAWAGLWLSVFPTIESLAGQAIALTLVVGSYGVAQKPSRRSAS